MKEHLGGVPIDWTPRASTSFYFDGTLASTAAACTASTAVDTPARLLGGNLTTCVVRVSSLPVERYSASGVRAATLTPSA